MKRKGVSGMSAPAQPIQLVVGEPNALLGARWQAVFADVAEVEICALDQLQLWARPDIQCAVTTNQMAGEHWCGGRPIRDGVQFCSTAVYRGWGEPWTGVP